MKHRRSMISAVVLTSLFLGACGGSGGGGGSSPAAPGDKPTPHTKVNPVGMWVVNQGTLGGISNNSVVRLDVVKSVADVTFSADTKPAGDQIYPDPGNIVSCGGAMWVGSKSFTTMTKIDPNYNQVLQHIGSVQSDAGMACANDVVWTVSASSVYAQAYNTATDKLGKIALGAPGSGVAVTTSGVWILDMSGSLLQVDAKTFTSGASFNINSSGTSYTALGMTGISNQLWIAATNNLNDKIALIKVDTDLKKVVLAVDLDVPGVSASGMALGQRLDLAIANGKVWFPATPINAVIRVNAATGKILDQLPVGKKPTGISTGYGTLFYTNVWVTNAADGTVNELDGKTGTVLSTIAVGKNPIRVRMSN